MTVERENRYKVIKIKDLNSALTEKEALLFESLCDKVAAHREGQGKIPLVTVVTESDWEEYELVWSTVEAFHKLRERYGSGVSYDQS